MCECLFFFCFFFFFFFFCRPVVLAHLTGAAATRQTPQRPKITRMKGTRAFWSDTRHCAVRGIVLLLCLFTFSFTFSFTGTGQGSEVAGGRDRDDVARARGGEGAIVWNWGAGATVVALGFVRLLSRRCFCCVWLWLAFFSVIQASPPLGDTKKTKDERWHTGQQKTTKRPRTKLTSHHITSHHTNQSINQRCRRVCFILSQTCQRKGKEKHKDQRMGNGSLLIA